MLGIYQTKNYRVLIAAIVMVALSACGHNSGSDLGGSGGAAANVVGAPPAGQASGAPPGSQGADFSPVVWDVLPALRRTPTGPGLSCGGVVTASATLTANLDCSSYSGVPIVVNGSNIVIDGGGYKLILNSAVKAGILATGTNVTIQNFTISGNPIAAAIVGYDVSNFIVQNNVLQSNYEGVEIYSQTPALASLFLIQNNSIPGSLTFGVYAHRDQTVNNSNFQIQNNDLSNTGLFAIRLDAANINLSGCDGNIYSGSNNGLMLSGGNVSITSFDLSNANIVDTGIMVSNAATAFVQNSNLTVNKTLYYGTGISIYNTAQVIVNNNNISGTYLAVKLLVENTSIKPNVQIQNNNFSSNQFGGLMIQSLGGAAYQSVSIQNNNLSKNPSGYAVWLVSGSQFVSPVAQINNLY